MSISRQLHQVHDKKYLYYELVNSLAGSATITSDLIDRTNAELSAGADPNEKFNDDNYFILGNSGKKVSRTSLSLIYTSLGNVIGRRLSIRTARHIKVTNNVNIKKVNDLATEMRHDPTTALSIYAKHR